MKFWSYLTLAMLMAGVTATLCRAEDKPAKQIKALLIAGGCCHDYAKQKDILKKGLEERANITVDIVYSDDKGTAPKLSIYGNPDYAKGYDVVIHDECSAGIKDEAVVRGVIKPHDDGIPGVNLHCAMHCYRIGNPGEAVTDLNAPHALWFNYLGLQSSGHGPQAPIQVTYTDKEHQITKGLADWTTINEELYNNIKVYDKTVTLAHGKQVVKQKDGTTKDVDYVVTWLSMYKGETRVFSTTLGHNNDTVADPKFLDLVARGLVWAVNRPDALKK